MPKNTDKHYISTKLSHFMTLFSNYTSPKGQFKNDFGLNKGFLDYLTFEGTLKKPAFLRGTPRNAVKHRII